MSVFEQRTSWKTRRDVAVDDIAPNMRYVHVTNLHAITLTLRTAEALEFADWCSDMGITITSTVSQLKTGITQFIMPMLTENQVMLIKLSWSRYDIS